MKNNRFKIFLIVLVLGCMGCGANLKTSDAEISESVLAQVEGRIPRFRSFAGFPGRIIGYTQSTTGFLQIGNEVCLELFHFALPESDDVMPVRVTVDMQPIDSDDIDVRDAEETTLFCYSPYISEGAHEVDIDLLTPDGGIDAFILEFYAQRHMGVLPMELLPAQLEGFENDFPNPVKLVGDMVCMTILRRILQTDVEFRNLVRTQIDNEVIEAESIDTMSDDEAITYCYDLSEMPAGLYDLEVQVLTISTSIATDTNSGLFEQDVVQVGEVYGWEFVVDDMDE